MVVWILSLLGSIGLWVAAVLVMGKAADPFAAATNAPLAGLLAGGGALVGLWAFLAFLLWLAVSAIVREHQLDRAQRR